LGHFAQTENPPHSDLRNWYETREKGSLPAKLSKEVKSMRTDIQIHAAGYFDPIAAVLAGFMDRLYTFSNSASCPQNGHRRADR
jgi:hypothetical protein